jgi:hypothetical protein
MLVHITQLDDSCSYSSWFRSCGVFSFTYGRSVYSFSEFQTWILCALLLSHLRATSRAHVTFLVLSLIILMTSGGVQILNLLILWFSPSSCYFAFLSSKYYLRHAILRLSQVFSNNLTNSLISSRRIWSLIVSPDTDLYSRKSVLK